MAAGDFSATQLMDIALRAEEMWSDNQMSADLKANADAAIAVKQNSTARIIQLEDKDKDRKVKISWIDSCAVTVEDCESNCTIDGVELETAAQEYELDTCKKADFSVDAEKTRTNDRNVQEIAARGLASRIKALDEFWAQQILTKLKSFAGQNVHPQPYTYAAGTTTIPNAQYNLSVIPEIMLDSMMNKLGNAYYINNGDLWIPYTNAQLNAGNLDGKGDLARIQQLRMYFDMYNFAGAGLTESIFSVAPGAVAFTTKTRYTPQPEVIGGKVGQTRYTVPSSVIPDVSYDVIYELSCKTVGTQDHIMHTWRIITRGGIFLNPESCPIEIGEDTVTRTGVLSYTKGA